MRILFLSRWYPYPPDNGSKIRVFNLLRGLCERHDVSLISFHDPDEPLSSNPPPGGVPIEIRRCAYREFEPTSGRALLGYVSRTPRYLVDTYRPEMDGLIREAVGRSRYDLVIASQLPMAVYWRAFAGIPAVFDEVELGIYWPDDPAGETSRSGFRRRMTWSKHRRFMSRLLEHFRFCTVASEVERRLLATAVPGFAAVHVVPNSIDTEPLESASSRKIPESLIFAGSLRYAPNRDAMAWFVREILPQLRAEMPGVRVTITGDPGTDPLPSAPEVVMTGRVPDVRALVAHSAVSLAPIRAGGGTRLKILEAMAVGTPVVATSKAVEGLEVHDGEHVLVADTPHDFAAAVRELLRNPAGARELAHRAWRLCRARYDSKVVVSHFLELIGQAAA